MAALEREQPPECPGTHRCRPRYVAEQRDLPERVRGPERGDHSALLHDLERPLVDNVEPVARLPLAHDLLACSNGELLDQPGQALERRLRQRSEARVLPQPLQSLRGNARLPVHAGERRPRGEDERREHDSVGDESAPRSQRRHHHGRNHGA